MLGGCGDRGDTGDARSLTIRDDPGPTSVLTRRRALPLRRESPASAEAGLSSWLEASRELERADVGGLEPLRAPGHDGEACLYSQRSEKSRARPTTASARVTSTGRLHEERDRRDRSTEREAGELLQARLPSSKVVKTFNQIYAADLTKHGQPPGTRNRRAPAIAGDDANAKATVSRPSSISSGSMWSTWGR